MSKTKDQQNAQVESTDSKSAKVPPWRPRTLSHFEVMDIAKRFAEDANKIFPTATVMLFGSYAKGLARPNSDIDIALLFVEYPTEDPQELFDKEIELNSSIFDKYKRDIQFVTRTFDDPSGFVHNILDTGVIITDPCHNVSGCGDTVMQLLLTKILNGDPIPPQIINYNLESIALMDEGRMSAEHLTIRPKSIYRDLIIELKKEIEANSPPNL